MYKNGVPIGAAYIYIDTAITSYTPFSFDINYILSHPNDIPDSADISATIGINSPHGNSVAYLDNLSFDGFRTGIKSPNISDAQRDIFCQVYPNPTTNNLTMELSGFTGRTIYTVCDITGRSMFSMTNIVQCSGRIIKSLDVSALPAGTYFLNVQSEKETTTRRFVVEK